MQIISAGKRRMLFTKLMSGSNLRKKNKPIMACMDKYVKLFKWNDMKRKICELLREKNVARRNPAYPT